MATKSFEFCNKCKKEDNCALIHCAVCSYPYHAKCVAPKLTVKACDELVANNNFQFYCDDHQSLCVHKLLNRINLLERKFRKCTEPLVDITNELDKHQADLTTSGYNKVSVIPPTLTVTDNHAQASTTISTSVTLQPSQNENELNIHHNTSNVTLRRHTQKRINYDQTDQQSQLEDLSRQVHDNSPLPAESDIQAPVLRCIEPRRAIYLSGLEPDTSSNDILAYIEYKVKAKLDINIRKMQFHTESRAAVFVIYVGNSLPNFKLLCNSSFWPDRVHCREYDFFRKHQKHQKISDSSQPKTHLE
jgi:hypothetical protein